MVGYAEDKDEREDRVFFLCNLLLADSARSTILSSLTLSPFLQSSSRLFALQKDSFRRYHFLQVLYFAFTI